MNRTLNKFLAALMIVSFLAFPLADLNAKVQAQGWYPPVLEPQLSPDGLSVENAIPPLVILADPNPEMQNLRISGPTASEVLDTPGIIASTISITFVPDGGKDPWGQRCYTFPAGAKTAFKAAATIWAYTLYSPVPIKIRACWANLGSSSGILGYSGGATSYRDFAGAPVANTWYASSLANSLAGTDLGPTKFDMNITYNKFFPWYYGTDANPPAGKYDLVSVATHEIAHGLNFAGTAKYASGSGSYGISGYPNIYDTFMEDGAGMALTSYSNPSLALGSLLTGGNLWFDGPNANTGNGGSRVKMYAPGSWSSGSSFSHLDYTTYAGTLNSLMVYAMGSGSANHNPGPVSIGLLKDLGWGAFESGTFPFIQSPSGTIPDQTPTFQWTEATGTTQYRYQLKRGTTTVYTRIVPSSACTGGICSDTPLKTLATGSYKWRVQAMKDGVWGSYSTLESFSIKFVPIPKSPTGQIDDRTPDFVWSAIGGVDQYHYQLWKGTSLLLEADIPTSSCVTTLCTDSPGITLGLGAYKWRVRTMVEGTWKPYSAFKTFSEVIWPNAGYWRGSSNDFYVTANRRNVDNFRVAITVSGCGSYIITHTPLVKISNSRFAFSGPFYANGTFTSITAVKGKDGLSSFYIPGCGYVSSKGAWNYTIYWQYFASPPAADLVEAVDRIDRVTIKEQALEGYHVIRVEP